MKSKMRAFWKSASGSACIDACISGRIACWPDHRLAIATAYLVPGISRTWLIVTRRGPPWLTVTPLRICTGSQAGSIIVPFAPPPTPHSADSLPPLHLGPCVSCVSPVDSTALPRLLSKLSLCPLFFSSSVHLFLVHLFICSLFLVPCSLLFLMCGPLFALSLVVLPLTFAFTAIQFGIGRADQHRIIYYFIFSFPCLRLMV